MVASATARSTVRVWAEDLEAGRLPKVSPLSGEAATASRLFRYRTEPAWTPIWTGVFLAGILIGVGWIPVLLLRLAASRRTSGPIHMTRAEIASIRNRKILTSVLLASAVGLIALSVDASDWSDSWSGPLVVLALIALIAGLICLRTGITVRGRVTEPQPGKLALEILDAHPAFLAAVAAMYGSMEKSGESDYFRSDLNVGEIALSWNARGPYSWEIRDSDMYGDYLLAGVHGYKVRVYPQDPSLYQIDVISPVGATKEDEKAWFKAFDATFHKELIPGVGTFEPTGFSYDRQWRWTGAEWRPISEYHGVVPPARPPASANTEPDDSGITSRYPVPDRSNMGPDADEGSLAGLLAGNRPYRIESWSQDETRFLTIFFSDLDIEAASAEALLRLVEPVLSEPLLVEPKWRHLDEADVHRIIDAAGNTMYSLTFVVIRAGDE